MAAASFVLAFCAPLRFFALALRLILLFLGGFIVRTRCPSISKFRLGFSFSSFSSIAALAWFGATPLAFSFCHLCSFFCVVWNPVAASMVAILWSGILYWLILSFPSPWPVWSWCGCSFSESCASCWLFGPLLSPSFCAFGLTSSSYFLVASCVRLLSGVLRRSLPSLAFFYEVFLFFWCGGLACGSFPFLLVRGLGLLSSVLLLKTVDSSFGSGEGFFLLSLSEPFAFALLSSLWIWFRQNFGVYSFRISSCGPQVVLLLGLASGAAAPYLFFVSACGLSVGSWEGSLFCLSLLRLRVVIFMASLRHCLHLKTFGCVFYCFLLDRCIPMLPFFAAFFFADVYRGPGVLPFWSFACSHLPFAALCSILSTFALFFLVSLFAFSVIATSHFWVGLWQ